MRALNENGGEFVRPHREYGQAYIRTMRNAIELVVEIVSAALLSSIVGAAIGVVWFAIEATP